MDILTHADLAARIASARPRLANTRLVLLDGPAGSGKTTLAAGLADELPDSVVVHMDDLYRGWETDFAEVHNRVRGQLVEPLAAGQPARYQRYDWDAGAFGDWVDVPVPGVLILEGVGSGARALDDVSSLLLWIEVSADMRVRRGVERDGEAVLPQWLAWMRHEAAEHARQATRERADIVLRGDGPDGQPIRWM
ncbi:MAG TPA: 4-amino-4-deoxy-L-arabinose transferase [Nocardioidaceae bacterium]|nr:4-amino-4-deoxy-L-arabinose transferase [Nocardioidaceae bacterium]